MRYKVEHNRCRCHPETCNCDDYMITKDGEKWVTIFDKGKAFEVMTAMNFYDLKVLLDE